MQLIDAAERRDQAYQPGFPPVTSEQHLSKNVSTAMRCIAVCIEDWTPSDEVAALF